MGFVKPMSRMLDRAAREVDFTAEGLKAYKGDVIRFVVNRLRVHQDIQRHPEILDEDISDPLIILGLPRSGTTKLQRMMADAPDVQKLFMWRMWNPAPFPNAVPGQPDPRMTTAVVGVGDSPVSGDEAARAHAMAQAAHATAMAAVEEEFVLFDFTVDESVPGFDTRIPLFNYKEWVPGDREADREAYRYVRTLLQYLQWQDGGKRNRPLIMKAVMHHPHLDTLLECFPRATLVHCHRDPQDSIPSLAKMMWAVWSTKANVDKEFAGQEFLKWGSTGINRYMEARNRLKLDDRILDIQYENIRSDVMPAVREIYKRAGWVLTPEAEQATLKWEKNNEQGKHGKHSYSLEEFGLTDKMIDAAFEEYIRRFIKR